MVRRGDLDEVVLRAPPVTYEKAPWFAPHLRRVNLTWLTAKWVTDCDHGAEEEEQ
jgi:hypothetical protein